MKKNIVALVMLCSSVAALSMSAPAKAQVGQNVIGPALAIGGGQTTVGVNSKFRVSDNLSLRPFIYFPSGGTTFGSGLTYDFDLSNRGGKVQITPFIGGSVFINSGAGSNTTVAFTGGADFDVTDTIQLKAALDVPLSSNNSSTLVTLGAGFKF
ncbi:hypothetical protein [Chamaesiphon minutus]|uniref:Outer membrane protein beta-barrel domain-containing protein n=1 Tax=Chamaesiphon minutus (strain ATCC 27169 / PCC 6605) TaxID=1173020 RepID=K9UI95_CHAP6|nr:hypothetical protein [Chamaesiphon minutus]AFY94363.1 hypothetical protein Cha6605_3361 [Chamaesiphon minutus PCC 6605]